MSAETAAQADTIKAAMSVARDLAEGRLTAAELDAAAAAECRELFGTVAGPVDALWPVHLDVVRQVLALGGVSADELSEWLAVARQREGDTAAVQLDTEAAGVDAGEVDTEHPEADS